MIGVEKQYERRSKNKHDKLAKNPDDNEEVIETHNNRETKANLNEETDVNVNKEQEEVNKKHNKLRKHVAKRKESTKIVVRDVKKHKSIVEVRSGSQDCIEVDNNSRSVKKEERLLIQRIPANWFMALIPKIPRQHRASIRKIGFGALICILVPISQSFLLNL
ncbi:uncharacterized protein [Spinacia oleracea]|uniref:Uncharacterized protein n=1 Tax=Spinacia oleracea TaxID=3562 RepID=A0ABM3RB02_SPIOL|nr:uncharacterized protein LOC110779851 [Spinacia oleracea]XP_056692798.1 uncharacterized protein LOC110779851 [Spinacia oleracea]